MNRKLLGLQMAACGLLGLVLLAQWGYGRMLRSQLEQSLANKSQSDYQADALPELDLPDRSADYYGAIVERPLFVEGRKPIVESAGNDAVQSADNGQIDDWLLIGVYSKDKDKKPLALFRKQNESKKFLKLAEEQTISGWSIQKIQPDRVFLQQGGQLKTVMLRKPRPQIKPPLPRPKPPVPAAPAVPVPPAPAQPPVETSNDESE